LSEGQTINEAGEIEGDEIYSDIASYWFRGVMAAFQTWSSQVSDYLKGVQQFEDSGDETQLKTAANINRAEVYTVESSKNDMLPDEFLDRAEPLPEKQVPDGCLFLVMAIDVQKNRFVVQVQGYGNGGESWIVDRFSIRQSNRIDENGEPLPIDPASFSEDWDILDAMAIGKTYPIAADNNHVMKPRLTLCDSGGYAVDAKKGKTVTEKAYGFYRKLRKSGRGRNFYLIKGGSRMDAPRIKKSFPDAQKKDRHATARGEIPVYMLNSNMIKDMVKNDLDRQDVGAGYVHFPDWLPPWFYNELTAETRTPKGWVKEGKQANEAFDLVYYCKAAFLILKGERIDWDNPPSFARHFGDNPMVTLLSDATETDAPRKKKKRRSIKDIAGRLN